jgi:two-component system, cell cycle sensor histidine kinase and response regulator CckA
MGEREKGFQALTAVGSTADSGGHSKKLAPSVLMVEDESGLRLAVAGLLRRKGFCVMEAPEGAAAIELFRENSGRIDVILLDLTLPGISSLEVISETVRIRPDVKIILTSAYSRETAARELRVPQVKAFIRKPYQIGDLVEVLSN